MNFRVVHWSCFASPTGLIDIGSNDSGLAGTKKRRARFARRFDLKAVIELRD